ncbi:MAG: carboxypeptidase regulatory-like domain-containing protein [Clostridiales bacterium]|nr:carboxypeptidase regulatory-like domain-containing protein [Clostridiales bacterium]
MRKKTLSLLLAFAFILALLPASALAYSDPNNGDWSSKTLTLAGTSEAELMVRVGDIDACNDEYAVDDYGYNPFTAEDQYSHGYPWEEDPLDPVGTDRIYVGSKETGATSDGYSSDYYSWLEGDGEHYACARGAMTITLKYDASAIQVRNALLQICIDDFQALSWDSNFTVAINGRDAPFIAELLNHVDQTGPTSYIVSAIIPSGFYNEIASGKLVITIDETTGVGDGYAVDFVKLLINYNESVFKGRITGYVYGAENATVRLLGTSTTVTTDDGGKFTFDAVPGLNVVRASAGGYKEEYEFGIVLSSNTKWEPYLYLTEGVGTPDIDFSKFAATDAWSEASEWATEELQKALELGLIPDALMGADMTKPINRAEFAAVCVKAYENLANTKAQPIANNPFTDCDDPEVLKAYNINVTDGTSHTTFSPNLLLNREQAATMLTRVYKKVTMEGWTLATDGEYKLDYTKPPVFADDDLISGWAKDSVYFMCANNIIKGVGGNKFAPKNTTSAEEAMYYANATREQAIIIAARLVENLK